jgi:hypothetical protein
MRPARTERGVEERLTSNAAGPEPPGLEAPVSAPPKSPIGRAQAELSPGSLPKVQPPAAFARVLFRAGLPLAA